MDINQLFQWAIGILGTISLAVTGWIIMQIGALKQRDDDMLQKHDEHRLHVSENYARKNDMREAFDRLDKKLDKIFDKLDEKADK